MSRMFKVPSIYPLPRLENPHDPALARSDLREDSALELPDARLVPPVEGPLLDALAANETCLGEDLQMLAHGRMSHAKFLRDQHPAHPVLHQVTVNLRREVLCRGSQPLEDLQAALVG